MKFISPSRRPAARRRPPVTLAFVSTLVFCVLGLTFEAARPAATSAATQRQPPGAGGAARAPKQKADAPAEQAELAPDRDTPAGPRASSDAAKRGRVGQSLSGHDAVSAEDGSGAPEGAGTTLPAATTITWRAANNPHVVNGTYTIPADTTLILEPGVVVQINANSTLVVAGALTGRGTPANHISITGAAYSSKIQVTGRLELDYTDISAQTDPQSRGSLLFTNCRWFSFGSFFSPTGYLNDVPPYVELRHCTFEGQSASATLTNLTLVLRDVSFTGGAYLRAYYAYVRLDDVRSDNSAFFGLQFLTDGELYINTVQIRNAAWAALYLGGGNYGGNFALGPDNVLASSLYPVSLDNGGLLPASVVPASGNANNYVHAEAPNGAVDWRGPITWSPLAVPYVITDPLNIAGAWRILPGTLVKFGPNFSGISDQTASLEIRGTPGAPVRLERLNPAQAWGGINYQSGGQRIAHTIFDGATSGLSTTTQNGSFVYGHDLILRNAVSTGAHGATILIGTQFINNAVGYLDSGGQVGSRGILNGGPGPASPNSFVGNAVGLRATSGATIQARNNWWNSPTGPTYARNPGGTGDRIEGNVDFVPFLTAPPDYVSDTPPVVRQHRPGFSYEAGTRFAVSWDAEDDRGIARHRILFSPAGNYPTSFQTVIDNLPAGSRAYEFTVPNVGFQVTHSTSTIRVVTIDTAGNERFDDQFIQIPSGEVQCSVTHTSNIAGRTFQPGERFAVTWTVGSCSVSNLEAFVLLENDQRTFPLGGASVNLGTLATAGFAPNVSTDRARLLFKVSGSTNRVKYFYGPRFQIRPDARVGDAAPAVSMQTPAAGASYPAGSVVPVTWTASDDEALRSFRVQVSYDGGTNWTTAARDLPAAARSYNFQTAPGTGFADVRVKVIAVDLRFQQTSDGADRPFALTPTPPPNVNPTARLTQPAPDSVFLAGSNVILRADAADPNGAVTRVEFYAGPTLVGTDTTAPYQITWNNAPAGTHSVTARATDNGGSSTTSAPVNLVVRAATPPASLPGTVWGAIYNGPSSGNDSLPIMELDAQGNLYLAGRSTGVGTGTDITTVKYDAQGNEQWVARFNGTGNGGDVPHAVAVDAAGAVYVTGSTWRGYNFDGGFETDWVTLKYDAVGNLLWTRHYSGTGAQSFADTPADLALDAAGNLYVTGSSQYNGFNNFLVGYATTIKYDADGNQLWARTYDTTDRWGANGASLDVDSQGNVYVAGTVRVATVNPNTTTDNVLTLKYDAAGALQWARQYDDPGPALSDFDRGERVKFDHGNVYVLGANRPNDNQSDVLLLKYDAGGNLARAVGWTGAATGDDPNAWDFDAAGNFYVTGLSDSQSESGRVFTLKFDPALDIKWERIFDGPAANGYDAGYDARVNAAGGVYVVGPSAGADGDYDFLLLRYLADGTEAGTNRYEGPAGLDDVPQAVRLDAAGNLYVTGDTRTTRGDLDFLTVRIAAPAPPPAARAGDIVISEFRAGGPGGEADEFVELYNKTSSPVTVGTTDGTQGWAVVTLDGAGASAATLHVIPAGTVLPARGNYLLAGVGYTLAAVAAPDASYSAGIPDNGGVALFASASNLTLANRLDAVGFGGASGPVPEMMREGAGLTPTPPALAGATPEYSYVRKLTGGAPQDTDNNANDFLLVSADGTAFGAAASVLGAPGPESSTSPAQRNAQLKASLVDPQCGGDGAAGSACARARSLTPVANGAHGTLSIRRKFTNRTGGAVTRLRFRVVDMTTAPAPPCSGPCDGVGDVADLRAINAANVTATTTAGATVSIRGLTLEQGASQPAGGGVNSTVAAGTITAASPLAAGASINVQFTLGVERPGSFRFLVNVEALNSPPPATPARAATARRK